MTTTPTQQPDALRLADALEKMPGYDWNKTYCEAAFQLRHIQRQNECLTDAYCGAREDLAIWKRRALEAEEKLRAESAATSRLVSELNAENGPTHMGEAARQHNPLSYDEVLEAIDKTTMALRANAGYPHAKHIVEIARAIEAAHGIVEKP